MDLNLRTIKQCFDYIKGIDKESAVTIYFLRTLCSQGRVNYTTAGTKILINLDSLLNVLGGNQITNEEKGVI